MTSASAGASTGLTTTGTISDAGAFVVTAEEADWAVEGTSGQIGTLGSGFIGVAGTGNVGGFFSGSLAAISLQPQDAAGAPTSGDYSAGDVVVDSNGVLYLCSAAGNPGTWTRVSDRGTHLLPSAQRAYDSRSQGGKFGPNEERTVTIGGKFGVPADAVALVGNLAVTDTAEYGNALVYAAGQSPRPNAASINWFAAGQTLNNALTAPLGNGGAVTLYAANATHLILDISGYIL